MKRVQVQGYVTYRLDAGTVAYPGFREQAAAVAGAGFAAIGIDAFEVTGPPDIWLTFPDDATFISTCGAGAAGCILYWQDPIMIFFRRALLYSDWKTTIAHEGINYGHSMGQHEQYFDQGEFRCNTAATYTVMSCGTGVWRPQPFDVETVCAVMDASASRFTGCGYVPPPATDPFWTGSRWMFSSLWAYDPVTDVWYDPLARLYWNARDQYGWRYTPVRDMALPGGAAYWTPELGHSIVP